MPARAALALALPLPITVTAAGAVSGLRCCFALLWPRSASPCVAFGVMGPPPVTRPPPGSLGSTSQRPLRPRCYYSSPTLAAVDGAAGWRKWVLGLVGPGSWRNKPGEPGLGVRSGPTGAPGARAAVVDLLRIRYDILKGPEEGPSASAKVITTARGPSHTCRPAATRLGQGRAVRHALEDCALTPESE